MKRVDPDDSQVTVAVDLFKLLADPTRLRIVWALLHGEHSVNRLAEHVGARPATVSQHLAKLRLSRLVTTRRDGTHVYYLIENEHVREVAEGALFQADHTVHDLPSRHDHRAGDLPRQGHSA